MAKLCPENKFNAVVQLGNSNPNEALEAWQDLARQYPSDPDVRLNYGIMLLNFSEHEKAVQQLELATERQASIGSLTPLMAAYGLAAMPGHALKTARRIRDRGGKDSVAELEAGVFLEGLSEKQRLEFERTHYEAMLSPSLANLNKMIAFTKKASSFLPAHNHVTTIALELMDWQRAEQASNTALAIAPDNIHALLNRVRIDLITKGLFAAQVWLEPVRAAPVGPEIRIYEAQATQAQAFTFLKATTDLEVVVEAYQTSLELSVENTSPVFEQITESFKAFQENPEAPLYDLAVLVPKTAIKKWQNTTEKNLMTLMNQDLSAMPGVLEFVRDYVFVDTSELMIFLVNILVSNTSLVVPNDSRSWTDFLRDGLQNPMIKADQKFGVVQVFNRKKLMSKTELETITGLHLQNLEIVYEPAPSPFNRSEMALFENAFDLMHQGIMPEARVILEKLVQRYPNHDSCKHNYALTFLHDATLPDGKARAEAIFEELFAEHPTYLFAKAELAELAMKRNDLAAAENYLKLPPDLEQVHALEYVVYLSAAGRLMVRQGNSESAIKYLDLIRQIKGEDSPAYLMLEDALNAESADSKLSEILQKAQERFGVS